MKYACIDANVILRMFTNDPIDQAEKAQELFVMVDRGELQLYLPEIVIAEVVWVLRSFYDYPAAEIATLLMDFLSHEGLVCRDRPLMLSALSLFAERNIDFADALVAMQMLDQGIEEIYSFDKHFDRLADITRHVPGE